MVRDDLVALCAGALMVATWSDFGWFMALPGFAKRILGIGGRIVDRRGDLEALSRSPPVMTHRTQSVQGCGTAEMGALQSRLAGFRRWHECGTKLRPHLQL
jgi:hypothetical protein